MNENPAAVPHQMISESNGHGGRRRGAGRRGYRVKVEECRVSLHIRQIYPDAKLQLTWPTGLRIEIDWQPGVVIITGSADRVRLRQRLPTVQTACHFGGSRSWFECPACGKRAARLFFRGNRFACRKCSRLVYSSSYASHTIAS